MAAFLVSLLLGNGWIQRALRLSWLVAVGKLSYSMYLFQGLAIFAAQRLIASREQTVGNALQNFALACACSIALSWLLAVAIERPLIRRGRAWAGRVAATQRAH